MSIPFAIVGALGRMGQTIATLSSQSEDLKLKKVFDSVDSSTTNKKYLNFDLKIEQLENYNNKNELKGIIDFSFKTATLSYLTKYRELGLPLVIGTTGYNKEEEQKIVDVAKHIPLLLGTNMSLGVNLLFSLVEQATRALKDRGFDIEVLDIHHNKKVDSPSGTSRTLEKIILKEKVYDDSVLIHGREGVIGKRKPQEVGSMALRGGDVVGDHTVYFFGDGERIELKHQAHSRNTFAAGSLNALRFLQGKPNGLYTMKDVLGI